MSYIINTIDKSLADIFNDKELVGFLYRSIELARKLEVGKFKKLIFNDDVFAISQNITLKSCSDGVFESHKEYIDVHIVVEGREAVEMMSVSDMPEPYDKCMDNDYYLYKFEKCSSKVTLDKNKIAVFLFDDGHKVGLEADGSIENVAKVVLKIKENAFKKEFIYA